MQTMNHKVDFKTMVRAEPEKVYDALTTPEGLDGWFTTGAEVDAVPGGSITLRWKDWGYDQYNGDSGGPVLEAERPGRFVFKWQSDDKRYLTTVSISIETHPEGTLVSLTEEGYEDSPAGHQDLLNRCTGWGEALTLMKFWVEHGVRY